MGFIEEKLKNYIVFIILLFVGFLIYGNVINGQFLFDDLNLIFYNKYVHSLSNFFNYFTSNIGTGTELNLHVQLNSNFYRPMQQLAYGIIYHFWGVKVQAYHILSILIHIINSFLVFLLLKRFSFSKTGCFFASLIFLVHPVQVEAVSYISGLSDPMGFMFVVSALLIYIDCYKNKANILKSFFAAFFFILAILSKESAFMFVLLAILVDVFYWKTYSKNERIYRICNIFIYLFIIMAYVYFRHNFLHFQQYGALINKDCLYGKHLHVRLFTFISILVQYFKLIFCPVHLYLEKKYEWYPDMHRPESIAGILILISCFIAAILSFFKERKIFLGISWFFLCLLPLMGWLPLNATYLEHWLYFPIVGVLIVLVSLFDSIKNDNIKIVIIWFLCFVLMLFGLRVIDRNEEWSDQIKFYQNELVYNPDSQRIHNNLALIYFQQGHFQDAIVHYNEAIDILDVFSEPHNNLGVIYMNLGQYELSEQEFYKSLKIRPNFIYSIRGLKDLDEVKKNLKNIKK